MYNIHTFTQVSSVLASSYFFFFFFFFFAFPAVSWVHHFWWDFCVCDRFFFSFFLFFFFFDHRGSYIPSLWMVHAWCVLVASIDPSGTWMSRSFESVWWNACVHRLDLGLYSHPKEFLGDGVRTVRGWSQNHVNSEGKTPSTVGSEEGGTCRAATCRTVSPTHCQLSYSGPIMTSSFLPT